MYDQEMDMEDEFGASERRVARLLRRKAKLEARLLVEHSNARMKLINRRLRSVDKKLARSNYTASLGAAEDMAAYYGVEGVGELYGDDDLDEDLYGDDDGDDDDLLGAIGYDDEDAYGDDELGAVEVLANARSMLSKGQQRTVKAAIPYMKLWRLKTVMVNPFRRRGVRQAAMNEISRRQRGGKRLVRTKVVRMTRPGGQVAVAIPRVVPAAPIRRVAPVPHLPPVQIVPSPIYRHPHAARRAARRARFSPRRAARRARFSSRFSGEMPTGFELTPKLGSAMWAHPLKSLLLIAGAVGVGIAVKEPAMEGLSIVVNKVRSRY